MTKLDKTNQVIEKPSQRPEDPAVSSETIPQGAPELSSAKASRLSKEINGPKGLEPTRYGDWESKGRCCDF